MTLAVSGDSITFPDLSVQNTSPTGFAFKNRIINGAMVIDQRNAGAPVTPTGGIYLVDRFKLQMSLGGKFSAQRSTVAPDGFTNSLLITSLSAYSNVSADYFTIEQDIEGFNFSDMMWGTLSAQTVTLSFWVRSSITGIFTGALRNFANTRTYPYAYTISVANTWEKKTVTIIGDTTGTWVGATNSAGVQVFFDFASGATNQAGAGNWVNAAANAAIGQVNLLGTSGATFYITGVQLEKGSTATSFDFRDYGRELMMCQRYYTSSFPIGVAPANGLDAGAMINNIVPYSTINSYANNVSFLQPMRAAPSVVIYNTGVITTAGRFAYFNGTAWNAATSNNVGAVKSIGFFIEPSGAYTAFVPHLGSFAYAASAEL